MFGYEISLITDNDCCIQLAPVPPLMGNIYPRESTYNMGISHSRDPRGTGMSLELTVLSDGSLRVIHAGTPLSGMMQPRSSSLSVKARALVLGCNRHGGRRNCSLRRCSLLLTWKYCQPNDSSTSIKISRCLVSGRNRNLKSVSFLAHCEAGRLDYTENRELSAINARSEVWMMINNFVISSRSHEHVNVGILIFSWRTICEWIHIRTSYYSPALCICNCLELSSLRLVIQFTDLKPFPTTRRLRFPQPTECITGRKIRHCLHFKFALNIHFHLIEHWLSENCAGPWLKHWSQYTAPKRELTNHWVFQNI